MKERFYKMQKKLALPKPPQTNSTYLQNNLSNLIIYMKQLTTFSFLTFETTLRVLFLYEKIFLVPKAHIYQTVA